MRKNFYILHIFKTVFCCFVLMVYLCVSASAEDFTKYYDIYSPEYIEQISYTRQQPAFKIIAPKGWYMALANDEIYPDRAIFFQNNPEKVLSQGHIETPNIRISFAPNPQKLTAYLMTKDYVSQIKSSGGTILTRPEEIWADSQVGSHFTALDPKTSLVMDNYIFVRENVFVSVLAICISSEFEAIKEKIKETMDSIKF